MTSANDKATPKKNFSLILILGFVSPVAILVAVALCVMAGSVFVPILAPLPTGTFYEPETADFRYLQHLPSPDEKYIFALFADYTIPVGDTGWHIFKFEEGFDIENFQISWEEYRNGDYLKNVIMSNYAEGGDHTEDPRIEIVDDKYLVFMRGGLYHSLYDIEADKTLVEVYSPWHEWRDSEENKSIKPDPNSEAYEKSIDEWKRKNLHEPILRVIQSE